MHLAHHEPESLVIITTVVVGVKVKVVMCSGARLPAWLMPSEFCRRLCCCQSSSHTSLWASGSLGTGSSCMGPQGLARPT